MSQPVKLQNINGKLPQFRSLALVAVGSNQSFAGGDVTSIVELAMHAVAEGMGVIRAKSRLFSTPAFPEGSGPDFVNAAFSVATNHSPQEVLARLHDTEATYGRRRVNRWGPRTLDLDLLAYDHVIWPDTQTFGQWFSLPLEAQMSETPDQLILPHPRLHERAFVLVPLAEVSPDWRHPVLDKSIRQLRDALPDTARQEVRPL